MKTFTLCLTTKKRELLHNFLKFLDTSVVSNFNSTKKNLFEKNSQIIVSVLKSPHVNKRAQEQFKLPDHKAQLRVQTANLSTFFFFIKQLNHHMHPEVNIIVKTTEIENYKYALSNGYFFELDTFQTRSNNYSRSGQLTKNLTTQVTKIQKNSALSKTLFLIELLDIYGKIKTTTTP